MGAATARLFANEGAKVIVTDLTLGDGAADARDEPDDEPEQHERDRDDRQGRDRDDDHGQDDEPGGSEEHGLEVQLDWK